jgi:hypothetical protein
MDFGKLSFVGSKPVNFSLRLKLNSIGIDRNETGILIPVPFLKEKRTAAGGKRPSRRQVSG